MRTPRSLLSLVLLPAAACAHGTGHVHLHAGELALGLLGVGAIVLVLRHASAALGALAGPLRRPRRTLP